MRALCCGFTPMFFGSKTVELVPGSTSLSKVCKSQKRRKGFNQDNSPPLQCNFILMMELRKKIITFRDIIDLPPCNTALATDQMIIGTVKDLHKYYPQSIPRFRRSKLKKLPLDTLLIYFCKTLQDLADVSNMSGEGIDKCTLDINNEEHKSVKKLVEITVASLNGLIKIAREKSDMINEDEENDKGLCQKVNPCKESDYCFPSPTSVLPQLMNGPLKHSYPSPVVLSVNIQAVGKLSPMDVKQLKYMLPDYGDEVPSFLKQNKVLIEEQDEENDEFVDETEDLNSQNETLEDPVSDSDGAYGDTTINGSKAPPITPLLTPPAEVTPPPELSGDVEADEDRSASPPPPPAAAAEEDLSKIPPTPSQPISEAKEPEAPSQGSALEETAATGVPSPPAPSKPNIEVITAAPSAPTEPNIEVTAAPPSAPTEPDIEVTAALPPPALPVAPTPPPLPRCISAPTMPNIEVTAAQPLPAPTMPNIEVTAAQPLPAPVIEVKAALPPSAPPVVAKEAPVTPAPPPLPRSISAPITEPPPPPPTRTASIRPSPPAPPMMASKGSGPMLPPPPGASRANGGAPPPPLPGSVRSKKADTRLKRSSHMGNLYRNLKGKVEGVPKRGPFAANGKKGGGGAANSGNGKQGMADALAEMTKRSTYFIQIEEDAKKYEKSIKEIKTSISTFKTSDMSELIKFHKSVESILENLTDESQVLARFEGFPGKKLEAIRTAAALYLKLESRLTELQNMKIELPLTQLYEKVERYFDKIKKEIDSLERTKDEEAKKLKTHNIDFDFQIIVRIKEAMVDVSSNCMELILKERREAKLAGNEVSKGKGEATKKVCTKMLWRAFQFAFRVYTFAGGHDDRADRLTRELAHEIETDPENQ
ncbi:formin-like protein 3 [Hibiscus syriacus]|uniref:formin-like protein 3 n=1 Tax=Hibiscus syriacus TaxID=106335 RepID=UPI001921F32E|nr:formin-like protein 3 [Hibiscus syriacus]